MTPEGKQSKDAIIELLYRKSGVPRAKRADDEEGFWFVFSQTGQDTSTKPMLARIRKAAKNNDHKFFIRLGTEIRKAPKDWLLDEDDWLVTLAGGWQDTMLFPNIGFCDFTDSALLDYMECSFPNMEFTFDMVRKSRQRLGLSSKKSPSVVGYKRKGKTIVLQLRGGQTRMFPLSTPNKVS